MNNQPSKRDNVFFSRNFRLVFLGALVSELGAILYNFAVSFYILQVSGNSAFLQGLYLALCSMAMLVCTPVGGVLGDRFNKAKIMYVCDYLKGSTIILATVLMILCRDSGTHITVLFALGILGNIISGIFNPAAGSLLPHILPEEKLQQANSYFTMKSSFESILGIVLAGVLYAALPIHTLFFLVGACFIASGLSEMLIRYDHRPSAERLTLSLAFADMRDGARYLRSKKAILALLGAVLFLNFFAAPIFGNFVPFFARTDLAGAPSYLLDRFLSPELWSSLFSVSSGIGTLIGAAVLSSRKPPEKCGHQVAVRVCLTASIVVVLSFIYWFLVARGDSLNLFLPLFCLGSLATGLSLSFVNIPITTAFMRVVDRDKLSKVNSIISIGSHGMIPIASVLAGAVLQSLGSAPLLFMCAAGFAVTAVLLLVNRPVRDL